MRKKLKHITKKVQEGSKKGKETENNQVIATTFNIRELNSPIKRHALWIKYDIARAILDLHLYQDENDRRHGWYNKKLLNLKPISGHKGGELHGDKKISSPGDTTIIKRPHRRSLKCMMQTLIQ